jgi:hypothetical protein
MKPTLNELQERKRVADKASEILESYGERVSPPLIKIPYGYRQITPRRSSRIASREKPLRPGFIESEPVHSPVDYDDEDYSDSDSDTGNSSDEAVATLLKVSITMCVIVIIVNPIVVEAFRVIYYLLTYCIN